jgi:polysulfide reductase chain C
VDNGLQNQDYKLVATGQANQIEDIKHLKPQKEWGWQVAVYLFLAGIGAGSLAFGILMDWLGYAPHPLRPMLLWGPILVAIGALFLVLKLGIKRRFLNTILNPKTSWLSRGFYILSMCIVVGALILGITLLPFLGVSISDWSSLILVLEIIGFILALATAVYTGILIQSVKYVPFWNTPLLPALFTVSALSTGAMAIIMSALGYSIMTPSAVYPHQVIDILISTEQIIIIVEAFVLFLYLFSRYKAESEGQISVRMLLSGKLKFIFWLGIIVSGFLFPVILEYLHSKFPDYSSLLFLGGLFSFVGGFSLRYGVIYAGIKEQHPLHKWIELKNNLVISKENLI